MRNHLVHERIKRNRYQVASKHEAAVTGINGTVSSTITIHHRLQVINGRIRSPITGRPTLVSDMLSNSPELVSHVMPRMENCGGIEHILLPAINFNTNHAHDYHGIVESLAPSHT